MENVALAAPSPSTPEAWQVPTQRVGLGFMVALTITAMSLYILFTGIGGLLLPLQVGLLAPKSKIAVLGLFTGIAVLVALIANPIAGALSDRTTSRFGRRRPWILIGGLLTVVSLFFLWKATNLTLLFIGWCGTELFANCVLAAITAMIPDHVPENQRGTVSGIFGLALSFGGILGAVIAGQLFKTAPTNAYLVMLLIVLVTTVPFGLFAPDKVLPQGYLPPFRFGAFLKNFWIDPRKYPDFGWTWLTRFIPLLGYFLATTYVFYYLQDAIKYAKPLQGASTFSIIATAVSIVSTVLGGILSDRLRRRKVFVIVSVSIIAVSMLMLAFFQTWAIVLAAAAILGLGFGAYMAVDVAIVTQVLPSGENRAKDMGIINIANTLPHSLAPVLAGAILATMHSYSLLYVFAAVATLFGILVVLQLKNVR